MDNFQILTKVVNFKQNESCAECFDANFGQQDSFAQCFGQVIACYQKTPKDRKVRRVFSRQFRATGHLRTVFWTSFSLLTKVPKFKKNDSCAQCFDATFGQQDSCARCFGQVLACHQNTPSSRKCNVAQGVLTPISGDRTVAHSVLDEF